MSLVVIHGEDQVKTRSELAQYVTPSTIHLDGKTISIADIIQNLESNSMFANEKKIVVIEDLHKKRSKTELKEIVEYLSTNPSAHQIILWESKNLSATEQKKFGQARFITAKLSPVVFKLTDSLSPAIPLKTTLSLLQQSCQSDSPEMVLVMLGRQIRLMIQTFDPSSKMAPWQRGKLTATAKQLGLTKLVSLHNELANIDYQNKTGQLPVDLTSELQLWLAQLYQ